MSVYYGINVIIDYILRCWFGQSVFKPNSLASTKILGWTLQIGQFVCFYRNKKKIPPTERYLEGLKFIRRLFCDLIILVRLTYLNLVKVKSLFCHTIYDTKNLTISSLIILIITQIFLLNIHTVSLQKKRTSFYYVKLYNWKF